MHWTLPVAALGTVWFLLLLHLAILLRDTRYRYFGQVLCEIERLSKKNVLAIRLYKSAFVVLAVTQVIFYVFSPLEAAVSSGVPEIRGTMVAAAATFVGMVCFHFERHKWLHGFFLVSSVICRVTGRVYLVRAVASPALTGVFVLSSFLVATMVLSPFLVRPYKFRGKTVFSTAQKLFYWVEVVLEAMVWDLLI